MWLNRHKLNNSLVILIHGLWGRRWSTWRRIVDKLQQQFNQDPFLDSYDCYSWQYKSGFFLQPRFVPAILEKLDILLDELQEEGKYDSVVFVAHSQGGILAKLYILHKLMEGTGKNINIDLIITLGTPHRGTYWDIFLTPLLWIQNIPLIKHFIPWKQLGELTKLSHNLRFLKKNWHSGSRGYLAAKPQIPSSHRRYIKSVSFVRMWDKLVGEKSAKGFPIDEPRLFFINHRISWKDVVAISGVLSEHDEKTRKIYSELAQIQNNNKLYNKYIYEYAPMVVELLKGGGYESHHDLIQIKAADLLNDFLFCFQSRPLRGLSLPDCIKKYVYYNLNGGC